MIAIELSLDGEGAWPDLVGKTVVRQKTAVKIAALSGGVVSGKPSVAIRLDVAPDVVIVGETSVALFLQVADALKAKYGDPREGE